MSKQQFVEKIRFVEYFQIDVDIFASTSAFNPCLNFDSKLYVDPALVRKCKINEFVDASKTIETYFDNIIKTLRLSNNIGDFSWKAVRKKLIFNEIEGTCLGYSKNGTRGNSIGEKFSESIIELAIEMITLGESDPVIFEMASIFKEGIGSDRISDMITNIIKQHIYCYTDRVMKEIGIECNCKCDDNVSYSTILNPFNHKPVLLLPFSILSKLPAAENYRYLGNLSRVNEKSRMELEKYISFDKTTKASKGSLLNAVLSDKDIRENLLNAYKSENLSEVADQNIFEDLVEKAVRKYLPQTEKISNLDELKKFVKKINETFKHFIEDKGINQLLYDNSGQPLDEKHVQKTYWLIAYWMCLDANVVISPETDTGRGPVDFKLATGFSTEVLVEIKLTSNSGIKHGLEKQLPTYMEAEDVSSAYYLIVDLCGEGDEKINRIYNDQPSYIKERIFLFFVDGCKKPSASKI